MERRITPKELRGLRRELGYSPEQIAPIIECTGRTWRRWEAGTHRIPLVVGAWLRAYLVINRILGFTRRRRAS